MVFQSISTETKMKHNTRETEEVWKSLEEKERAEEESEGGERDEEEGRDDRDGGVGCDGWRDEAGSWPGVLL